MKLTWGAAFRDKDVRDWMSVGWEQWVMDNNFCIHWREKKNVNRSAGENGSENDKLGDDEIPEMELILEGDDDFESCRAGVCEEIHENEDEVESIMYGGSLLESFQTQDTGGKELNEVDKGLGLNESNDDEEEEGQLNERDDNEDEEGTEEDTEEVYTMTTKRRKKITGVMGQRKSNRVINQVTV